MTTKARCSIYETRPDICRVYPKIDHYIPSQCTYYFKGAEREGTCNCGDGACCAIARKDGEPGGAPMPNVAGGEPCKYLRWVDEPDEQKEKTSEPAVKIADQTKEDAVVFERAIQGWDPDGSK